MLNILSLPCSYFSFPGCSPGYLETIRLLSQVKLSNCLYVVKPISQIVSIYRVQNVTFYYWMLLGSMIMIKVLILG